MLYDVNIQEQELKNKISKDYFWMYDFTQAIGNIDFCVASYQSQKELYDKDSFLWAEAKKGISSICHSLVQLILTIGKARTFDKYLPPNFLGAFDAEKIAFIPYNYIQEIFYINDFNWNVTPSNYDTKEFKIVLENVKSILNKNTLIYYFGKDDKELKRFIKDNFITGKFGTTKTRIDKNNFIVIYSKWLQVVKPSIAVDWDTAKKNGVIDGDFYLADLLSEDNITLKDKLFVVLKSSKYQLNRHKDKLGFLTFSEVEFKDEQKAHNQFWNKYERPPKEEYWDYIIERRDLLVPQDVRERKGSFFTPQIWVELSQKYLADALGEDWQDEYYVWDCAAGTGNLLNGLTNKYNIWASTLDMQDVEVMKDRIKNGANLLEDHVFQFDFLNDEFFESKDGETKKWNPKIPKSLQDVLNNVEKRKKLVMYINPPYAEATSATTVTGTGKNKSGVATEFKINKQANIKIGNASNEIFALFMMQVYDNISKSKLALFSKLKFVQGTNFSKFKDYFLAKYLKGFVVPANTFDNVKGSFPIGFTIWDLSIKERINNVVCDAYNKDENIIIKQKRFYGELPLSINKWFVEYKIDSNKYIGILSNYPPDFQNQNKVFIQIKETKRSGAIKLSINNLIPMVIYFAVRHCIEATWLNDRDQFLYPNDGWKTDKEFQTDCLAFTLFHGQNRISSKEGVNHWVPFTEKEVNAREKFESNFMTDFIQGKIKGEEEEAGLFEADTYTPDPSNRGELGGETPPLAEGIRGMFQNNNNLIFSKEAEEVFDAGKELWKYYHRQPNCNVNASFYDIREHFQGRNEAGKMNNKSNDDKYNILIGNLRDKVKILAEKIEPKVYEYGFLKK